MINSRCIRQVSYCFLRGYVTKTKAQVIPEESMLENIESEVYKPRNHPGILKPRTVAVPEELVTAINIVTEDFPVKSLVADSETLVRHLKCKFPPVELPELKQNKFEVSERVKSTLKDVEIRSEEDIERMQQTVKDKVAHILKKEVYHWTPVNYNTYNSLLYLIGRIAPEYAVLVKIFAEIATRDREFLPRSLFDFGSGVGSVTWAANVYWKKQIFEYFNVDSSAEMNDLAQILLQGGKGTKQMPLKGVFYRQFLPASNVTYDLVVSSYSFLELPSRQSRLETILNLWNKTQKYLVIVEQGTNAGFKVVNELRDFILQSKNKRGEGHIFSPCPNDGCCPRFLLNDNTPCNFTMNYLTLPIGMTSVSRQERYCYIVLKKGKRDSSDPQWPRVVRETLVRSKHSICRMCTKEAKLKEVIFTASKHGKTMYHCARSTKWGDLLPIKLTEIEEETKG